MNILNSLMKRNNLQSNIPVPKFDLNDMLHIPHETKDINLIHLCAAAAQSWEAVYTGANGLRYLTHEEELSFFKVTSKEVCSPSEEDLSSIHKWSNNVPITPQIRKAYWFVSTFSNCATTTLCVETMLKELMKMDIQYINHEKSKLILKTCKVCGFSVQKKDGFISYNVIYGVEPDPANIHFSHELHNHIVISVRDTEGEIYIIDLAGAQFGNFSNDENNPHIIIEKLSIWRQKYFKSCNESSCSSYTTDQSGKYNRAKQFSKILFNFFRIFTD